MASKTENQFAKKTSINIPKLNNGLQLFPSYFQSTLITKLLTGNVVLNYKQSKCGEEANQVILLNILRTIPFVRKERL